MRRWQFGLVELVADLDPVAAEEVDRQASVLVPRSVAPELLGHRIVLGRSAASALLCNGRETIVQVACPNSAAAAVTVLVASRLAALREAGLVLTFHAAAVAAPAGVVLLAGPAMAGKTSVALEMERLFGWRIISTNMTCVRASTGELTGATARLTVRGEPGNRFRLVDHGTRTLPSTPAPVIAFADVMPGPSPLWADDHDDALVAVHRYAAEWPRMVTLLAHDLVDVGLDIPETAARRLSLTRNLTDRVRCVRLSGPATEIANWCRELVES